MKTLKTLFALVCAIFLLAGCPGAADRSVDDPPDDPGQGAGTTPPSDGGTAPPPAANAAWVVRPVGARTAEFNPGYLQCALAGTCASLTSVDQIAALISAAPSEARLVGECEAITPNVTGWSASGSVQAVIRKDPSTGWYRVEGGLDGVSNSTCNVSFIAPGCQAGNSSCWQQSGTAPLSDPGSHMGGPGMYCTYDNQGRSTGCAIEFYMDSNGNVVLTGELPNGP
jgi:hypothetical protein